jgi:hypothetical protein
MPHRSYDDQQLIAAVAAARSWRGVIRELGLKGRSTATYRPLRRHATRLELDTSHFTGQRRWRDDDLAAAVAASRSWHQVQLRLGLSGGGSVAALKGHALRLGIDSSHFGLLPEPSPHTSLGVPDLVHLPRAGSMLAASWFAMCGYGVSWPLEPCRYDLVVDMGGERSRVQVKTCRRRAGGWQVSLTTSGHPTGGSHARTFYDPDEIDSFFIIDGDLNYYLLPIGAVAGRGSICLSAYLAFRVGRSILELPLDPQPT